MKRYQWYLGLIVVILILCGVGSYHFLDAHAAGPQTGNPSPSVYVKKGMEAVPATDSQKSHCLLGGGCFLITREELTNLTLSVSRCQNMTR